jgi:hypothetical protein
MLRQERGAKALTPSCCCPPAAQDTAALHEEFQHSAPFSADGTSTAQALLQLAATKEELAAARQRVRLQPPLSRAAAGCLLAS